MTRTKLLVLAVVAGPLACSSSGNVNIGNGQLGGNPSDYAAQWDGYAEAYTFQPSGSDHIHLVLDAQGSGTLQVGTDALLPAPTDPNVGFPSGDAYSPTLGGPTTVLVGGVLYPVYAAQVQVNHIQFGIKPGDFWKAWCELQTSYRIFGGWTSQGADGGADAGVDGGWVPVFRYACLPGFGGSNGSDAARQCFAEDDSTAGTQGQGPGQSVDCGKYDLCWLRVCDCSETGCTSSPVVLAGASASQYPGELDAALDNSGKNLTGTLNLNGTRITVHLQRQ